MRICRSKWFVPLFSVALGLVMLVAQAIGHHPGSGFVSFGIMVAFGAVFLFGGRSETIRGLRGDGRDERFAAIDMRATWFSGMTVLIAVIIAAVVELARGRDGSPFSWLAALGGLSYLLALAVLRWRS